MAERPPERPLVIRSIETPDGGRCVDLFQRLDGSFGFEEYRRDAEDGRGWFAIAHHGGARFDSAEAALGAARAKVGWLDEVIGADDKRVG